MLNIQLYLQTSSLDDLKSEFGIKGVVHALFPNLVSLKYDQIESPKDHPIVRECRGIIIDTNTNDVVARGFDRFFNHGESVADDIDWDSARVEEKCDGSLILCYVYNNEWRIATSGTPDARGQVGQNDFTFAQLFQQVMNDTGIFLPRITEFTKDLTFLFELCTKYNRVVVRHHTDKIIHLATRNRVTGAYIDYDVMGCEKVKSFSLNNIDDILASFETISGVDQEGYVVVDKFSRRVKVKSPQYIALHHMSSNMGPKWFLKVVLSGEIDEVLNVFPEYTKDITDIKNKYDNMILCIEETYAKIKDIETQKDFALEAQKYPYSSVLFNLRNGKVDNLKQWFAKETSFNFAIKLFGIKEDS